VNAIAIAASDNRLLGVLSGSDRALLEPHWEDVALEARQVLEAPHAMISHVYFPTSGLASVVGTTRRDKRIEVGMIGYEGRSSGTQPLIERDCNTGRGTGVAHIEPDAAPRLALKSDSDGHVPALRPCLHDAAKPNGIG
jgi:hypothetical protein